MVVERKEMFHYGIPGKCNIFEDCLLCEAFLGDLTSKLQSNSWLESLEFIILKTKSFWKMKDMVVSNQMKSIGGRDQNH